MGNRPREPIEAEMPPRPAPGSASLNAIKTLMEQALTQPRGSMHRIPCATRKEAMALRSRMNQVRVNDRHSNLGVWTAANRQAARKGEPGQVIPASAHKSVFDELILRVEDNDVVVQVGSMTTNELLRLAGLPPIEGLADEAPDAPHTLAAFGPKAGAHDTAPRSDEDPFA